MALKLMPAPIDPRGYTVDADALRTLAHRVKPKLITVGSSLNLLPHPIREIREVADEVGALVLFDAAHLCGVIAGHAWPQPLEEGAHLMTMSTYKSLRGAGVGPYRYQRCRYCSEAGRHCIPWNDGKLRCGKVGVFGDHFARLEGAWASLCQCNGKNGQGPCRSTWLNVAYRYSSPTVSTRPRISLPWRQREFGGGQIAAKRLRKSNILSCGIGLPIAAVEGDINGLRMGTPEIVRWGMTDADMPELASLIARGLRGNDAPEDVARDVAALRRRFSRMHFVN